MSKGRIVRGREGGREGRKEGRRRKHQRRKEEEKDEFLWRKVFHLEFVWGAYMGRGREGRGNYRSGPKGGSEGGKERTSGSERVREKEERETERLV